MKIKFQQAFNAHKDGKLKEAEHLYRSILVEQPQHTAACNNLGYLLYCNGKLNEAKIFLKKAIKFKPDYSEAYINLGEIELKLNKLEKAEIIFKKVIELKPGFIRAYKILGKILYDLNKLEEAIKYFKKVIEFEPGDSLTYSNLGNVQNEYGKFEDAEVSFDEAKKLNPNLPEVHVNIGALKTNLGKLEEAEASFKKAIELKPNSVKAYYGLSKIKKFKKEDEYFIEMSRLSQDTSLSDDKLCYINFAFAKAAEDLNQYAKSFKFYSKANKLHKKKINYNISQDIELFDQIKKIHPNIKENSLKKENELNKPKITFILGMPRSGTSLVEQIISCHSKVYGAGELKKIEQFGHNIVTGISRDIKKNLIELRKNYYDILQNLSNGMYMVTDKMPLNFRYIGMICSAFPDAKIVHVKRDSAATCWSNFRNYFESKDLGFCYDLDDLANYYNMYQNLMKFWEKQYDDRIYNINYETLTSNQEIQIKKLIQYLDLEWEQECLKPEDNKRRVITASKFQVKQKIYQDSSKKWKKFEPFLNGVFDHISN
tara:strand:- start:134 stop:1759 length:1626 start_codon:yes stop_codon:yes gene_type:complete